MNAEHCKGAGTSDKMELAETVYKAIPFLWYIAGSMCFIVGSLVSIFRQ